MIYEIRGQRVMLDRDLAELYGVETRVLNQSVKRNANRFPEDFMFQLTKEECLRSQIVTLKEKRARHWLSCSPESRSHGGVSDLFEMRRERKRRTLPDPFPKATLTLLSLLQGG